MPASLRTSRAGLDLIKSFEGFRASAARLPDGRWTIGYGHVRSAREGLTIVERDAEDLLRYDLQPVEQAIRDWTLAPLTQNQFDALASLVFNISPGQFRDSEVLRRLNAGEYLVAAACFDAWRKARVNGRLIVVDALVRRRAAEKALFLEPAEGRAAAATPLVTPELDAALQSAAARDGAVEVATPVDGARVRPQPLDGGPGHDPARELSSRVGELARRAAGGEPAAPAGDPMAERIRSILTPAPGPAAPVTPGTPERGGDAASPARPQRPQGRLFIDDLEVIDPGLDPAALAGETSPPRAPRRAIGAVLLPWTAIGVLSLLGLAVGLVEAARADDGPADGPGLATLAVAFGLMFAMSAYFCISRLLDDRL
jgi:lysozyme